MHSAEEFEHMLDVLFFKRPFIPFPIIHKARESSIRLADDNARIFWRQHKDRHILQESISRITVPTLTIWGANEQIFHPSGAQMLKAMLPDQPIIAMPETGHLPQMEKSSLTARHYFDFIRTLQDRE